MRPSCQARELELSGKRSLVHLSCLLLLGVLANGCLSKLPLVKQSFAFPVNETVTNPASGSRVLQIRHLRVDAPFDSQSFIYRTGPYSYERDPYAEFLIPPAETLLATVQGRLLQTGVFKDVVRAGSLLKPDMIAEVYVRELYGDFRNRSAPQAVLRMRFVFFDAKGGNLGAALFETEYEECMPFRTRTAANLMLGWDEALHRIMKDLAADLNPS